MKKILISLSIVACSLFANPGLGVGMGAGFNNNQEQTQKSNEPKRYADILAFLKASADKGDGEHAFYLANFYLNGSYEKDSDGQIVEKNTELAIKYFKKSAETKYIYGAFTLGSLYVYHDDFIKLPNRAEQADKYLNLAIENEVYEAYTILGDFHFNYNGKDDGNGKKAFDFFSKGAEKNIATSQYALALLYDSGFKEKSFELKADEILASVYLTKACTNPKRTEKMEKLCTDPQTVERAE